MDTTEFALLLSDIPGIGDKRLLKILRRMAVLRWNPGRIAELPAAELESALGMPPSAADCLEREWPERAEKAAKTAREMRRRGITLLTALSASYPDELVESMDGPPTLLFAYGNLDALWEPSFAIALSNGASEEDLRLAEHAARIAQQSGMRVITGHNRPAYQRLALVARRDGRPVTYVLDRGLLDVCGEDVGRDLFAAARIWSPELDMQSDLVLSPFGLWDHGTGANNRRRDEMIFSLAWVVLAGYVRLGGMMEAVCFRALERGAPVAVSHNSPVGENLMRAGADALDFADETALRHWLRQHNERHTE